MAIRDTTKKPYVEDVDELISVGIDYPFHRSIGVEGWFASTNTTIDAVKNNIKMLLNTNRGERLMQPNLGLNLRRFLFEQFTDDIRIGIENDIVDSFNFWLPFVEIIDLNINMGEDSDIGRNRLDISLTFRINRDPHSQESVQLSIGGE